MTIKFNEETNEIEVNVCKTEQMTILHQTTINCLGSLNYIILESIEYHQSQIKQICVMQLDQ